MDDEYPEDWDGTAICDELRRQHSEIEQLKAERDRAHRACEQISVRLHAAQAERDALLADAERYRWLRDWERGTHTIQPMTGQYWDTPILCEELDAAIDAARNAEWIKNTPDIHCKTCGTAMQIPCDDCLACERSMRREIERAVADAMLAAREVKP